MPVRGNWRQTLPSNHIKVQFRWEDCRIEWDGRPFPALTQEAFFYVLLLYDDYLMWLADPERERLLGTKEIINKLGGFLPTRREVERVREKLPLRIRSRIVVSNGCNAGHRLDLARR